jgi:catechol 2,3-dioxygenase-like lactoylglutathione lyase family enzyme
MFRINHIHLKAPDPSATAQWYVDMFGAKIVGDSEGLGGSRSVRMDLEGGQIIVTGPQVGETLAEGTADSHYGLEHFGFHTDDVEGVTAHLESHGAEVLLPVTLVPSGARISYVKGPDNVRIELVQPGS